MRLSRSLSWGLAVVVALASGAVSCLLTLQVAGRGEPASVAPHGHLDDSVLVRRLEELGHRFDTALADARNAWRTLPPVRQEVDEPTMARPAAELLERMDRLERRLEQLLVLAIPNAGAGTPLARSTPVKQAELVALAALYRRDPATAKKSTMLLTPSEVIARFGFPDDVGGANGGGSFWNYHHRGPSGEPLGGIVFVFRDGRVAWHEISIPD